MILNLSCQSYGIGLKLPATSAEVQETLSQLRDGLGPTASIRISGVVGDVCSLHKYIQRADLESTDDLSRLNQLANMVDRMSAQEQHILSGALDAESINGLDDVLRVASSLGQYEFIQGVTSDKALGGWLVEHGLAGVDFPEQVRPYLDYAGIGAAYYADHGGAYTAHGYVKRREMGQTQAAENKSRLTLELVVRYNRCYLDLPVSDAELEQAKQILGVEELKDEMINSIGNGYMWSNELPTEDITLDGANVFAQYLLAMSDIEMRTFGAAMETEEPTTFSDAVCIAEDIDNYELVDVTEGEYARDGLRRAGAGDEIFDLLDGYTDYERMGRAMMDEDGVLPTSYGQVKRLSAPFPPQQDIGQTMY